MLNIKFYRIVKILILVLVPLFIFNKSCRNIVTGYDLNIAKSRVINNFSAVDYIKLANYYYNEKENVNSQDLLPYSLYMMKDGTGHIDFISNYLKIKFNSTLANLDSIPLQEKIFILYLLNDGALKEDNHCRNALIDFYSSGKGLLLDKTKADSIYKSIGFPDNQPH